MKSLLESGLKDLTTSQILDLIDDLLRELQRREAQRFKEVTEVCQPRTEWIEEV